MENKNKNYTGIIIFIILALGLGAFWVYSSKPKQVGNALPPIVEQKPADNPVVATTTQSGKIDEHLTINNELRDVNFCGKTYKVKQVLIDGVDMVQRVAELATKNLVPENLKIGPYGPNEDVWKDFKNTNHTVEDAICQNLQANTHETTLVVVPTQQAHKIKIGRQDEILYGFTINGLSSYNVSISSSNIYSSDNYEGSIIGPIGKLK
jgi:hypothetical protein